MSSRDPIIRLALLLAVLSGCATAPADTNSLSPPSAVCSPSSDVEPGHMARVTVTPEDAGTWLVEYAFAEPESALLFGRSTGDYRRESWAPLGDGVRLLREGGFDVLRLDPASRSARFRVTPHTSILIGEYNPAVAFSDGGRAVFVDQFRLVRVPDGETGAAFPDHGYWQGERPPFTFVLDTETPIVAAGERLGGPVCFDSEGAVEYVYYGLGDIVDGENFIGIVDPDLPTWMRDSFDADLGPLLEDLEEGFGTPLPQRAVVLFAHEGRETTSVSNKASVLDGPTLVFQVSGSDNDMESEEGRNEYEWTLAHESAHFYQRNGGYLPTSAAWIHEGHASLIAYGLVPENTRRAESEAGRCRQQLEGDEPLADVLDRSAYACGPWAWSLADRLAPDADVFSLWDRLREAADGSRAGPEHFLSALRASGAEGPVFEDLVGALRGDESVDKVALLDPDGVPE